jgi:hypothetical protein
MGRKGSLVKTDQAGISSRSSAREREGSMSTIPALSLIHDDKRPTKKMTKNYLSSTTSPDRLLFDDPSENLNNQRTSSYCPLPHSPPATHQSLISTFPVRFTFTPITPLLYDWFSITFAPSAIIVFFERVLVLLVSKEIVCLSGKR